MRLSNIEAVARALTERICRRAAEPDGDVEAWVDAHWYIAAADLEAGLIDDAGDRLSGYTTERACDAVRDWLRRNPR